MKRRVLIMLVILALSGCQSGSSGIVSDLESAAAETSSPTAPFPKTESSFGSETTVSATPSESTASAPYFSTPPVPVNPSSMESDVPDSHSDSSTGSSRTISKETSPPAISEPAVTSPASSMPETGTVPPVSQEPKPSPEDTLIPGKQYCDPGNDPYGVVAIIRFYAEDKGFVLNESLTIENSGYRGHPNVTDWTLEGVIKTLQYHVDKLLEINGVSYYNVVYRVYEGKLEYYFLVR